jgi:hypothetical protein
MMDRLGEDFYLQPVVQVPLPVPVQAHLQVPQQPVPVHLRRLLRVPVHRQRQQDKKYGNTLWSTEKKKKNDSLEFGVSSIESDSWRLLF